MRIAALALVLLASAPATARADSIVFRRGSDIWLMAPDGTGARQITSGPRSYEWPSAADDGTVLAPDTNGWLHRYAPTGVETGAPIPTAATVATEDTPAETATHVRISPDATKVAYDEAIDGDVTTLWTPADSTTLNFPGQTLGQEGLVAPSWIGSAKLLLSRDVSAEAGPTFSLYSVGGGDDSAAGWFSDGGAPWASGFDAAASRSGARVAVLEDDAANSDGTPDRVALRIFDGPTFRCEIGVAADDAYSSASPSFSPDGTRLAWAESDGIHVATADCADERVITLPGAWEPYWSAADLPRSFGSSGAPRALTLSVATRLRPHRLTVAKRGVLVAVTVSAPARVRLVIRSGGRVVGRASRTLANAGTFKVRVRVSRVSKRLALRVSAPGAAPVVVSVRPR